MRNRPHYGKNKELVIVINDYKRLSKRVWTIFSCLVFVFSIGYQLLQIGSFKRFRSDAFKFCIVVSLSGRLNIIKFLHQTFSKRVWTIFFLNSMAELIIVGECPKPSKNIFQTFGQSFIALFKNVYVLSNI